MSVSIRSKDYDFDSKKTIAEYDTVKIPYEVRVYKATTTEKQYIGNCYRVTVNTEPETVCVYDGNVIAKLLAQLAEHCDFGLGGNFTISDLVGVLNSVEVVGDKVLLGENEDNDHMGYSAYDLSRDAAGKFDLL